MDLSKYGRNPNSYSLNFQIVAKDHPVLVSAP